MGSASLPPATELKPKDAARRRIRRELAELWLDPPAYCRPGAEPVTDVLHWEVIIDGPAGTPYAGGTFPVDIEFPHVYPFLPPKITFKSKVYHPNIDEEGKMVLDVLKDNWSPAFRIRTLLLCIVSVLYDPLLDYPVYDHIADQYENQYEEYAEEAAAWTLKYASTPIVSHYPPKAVRGRKLPVVPHHPQQRTTPRRSRTASSASPLAAETEGGYGVIAGVTMLCRRAVEYVQGWNPYRRMHAA